MFHDLDLTIRALLDDATVPPSLAGVDVTFKPPDRAFTFTQPTVDLFLYGVHENRVLRDQVPIVEQVGGIFVRRMPPLRFDCDYLITTWSKKPDAIGIEEEHRLLGLALAKLSRFPLIPAEYLRNSLVEQPFPLQMWVAQPDDSKSLSEFWSALGVAPRSSFHLMVTVALDPLATIAEGPPVVTKQLVLDDDLDPATPGDSLYAIGGTVRDAVTDEVIAGARVTLDAARSATTDAGGRFRLFQVGGGEHTLTASAPGYAGGGRAIAVPAAAPNDYDIDLSS
ncbi:Pvc16 family protein [Streptosporangium soli]|nr:Pvc16 family protein [Streptosporangium sp. KLBMP 9127]